MKKTDKPNKPKKAKAPKNRSEERTLACKHVFSSIEKLEVCDKMTAAMQTFEEVENQMKSLSADFKARLKMLGTEVDQLANKARDGYEMREIKCLVTFNTGTDAKGKAVKKIGTKRVVDAATKAFIRDELMTQADYQTEMFEAEKLKRESQAAKDKSNGAPAEPATEKPLNSPEMPTASEAQKSTAATA